MNIKKFSDKIIPFLTDSSLIYTVFLNTSVMYYYRDILTPVWFMLSLAVSAVLFKIFDFIAKHKIIGFFTYTALFFLGIFLIGSAIRKGSETYPISFLLWFITTQDALEYSQWYTIAVFIFFTGFFTSVVYYFTKVQYRMSMTFLVFMIPFVIYGKESKQMPAVFIIMLSVMFILNVIKFNNIRNGDKSLKVGKESIFQSVSVYILVFGILASLLPKPTITADRTYLESLINMDAFTDMLISKINIFNNQSKSGKFSSLQTNDKVLYYANADEPLRLKTQFFTDYSYSDDQWSFDYDDYVFKDKYYPDDPSEIVKLIVLCSKLDKDFAKKYNINSIYSDIPDSEQKTLNLYSMEYDSGLLPVPEWLINAEMPDNVSAEFSNFGTVREKDGRFPKMQNYSISYYSGNFLYNADVYGIINSVSYDDAEYMYTQMYDILSENNMTDEAHTISDALNEYVSASDNLDYGNSQKIYNLAMQITDGIDSDYEKALAIEKYFLANNYIYDLTYKKGSDENAETFLFETKRGVCYEYATSMVLLARACGIPARYAEGYNMNQPAEIKNKSAYPPDYEIRVRDAHGFPELYISAVGWISFEPTVSDNIIDYRKSDISKGIYTSGIILAVCLIAGLLLFKFSPAILNMLFLLKIKRTAPDKTVSLVFIRVRQLFGFGKDVTAKELCQFLISEYQTDISFLRNLFEKSSYGKISLTKNDKKEVIAFYSELYKKFRKNKKNKI